MSQHPAITALDAVVNSVAAQSANLEACCALLRRYLDNHCANADAEGMSTRCECALCLDTRRLLFMEP